MHQDGNVSENISKFENLVKENKELLNIPVNYKFLNNTTLKLRPLDWILMSEYNENSFKIIEILLQNGANINTYYQDDPNNFTIFYMLILNNKITNQDKVRLAELFVKYGADVNLPQGVKNAHLLDESVLASSLGLYEFFLKNKIETKDRLWHSTRWINQNYKLQDYVNLVKKQDDFSKEIMNSQRYKERKENIVKLLKIFLKYNDLSDQQDTLPDFLKEIVFANNTEAIKLLLQKQTPYQKRIKELTLEYAKSFDRDEIVNLVKD